MDTHTEVAKAMQIVQALKTLDMAYPEHRPTREQLELYVEVLGEHKPEYVARAIKQYIRDPFNTRYPNLPQLLKGVLAEKLVAGGGSQDYLNYTAFHGRVMELVKEYGRFAKPYGRFEEDTFLKKVVLSFGSWTAICKSENLFWDLKPFYEVALVEFMREH